MKKLTLSGIACLGLMLAAPGGRGAVDLLGRILDGRVDVDAVSIQPPSLNSLFLKMTGRELRD